MISNVLVDEADEVWASGDEAVEAFGKLRTERGREDRLWE